MFNNNWSNRINMYHVCVILMFIIIILYYMNLITNIHIVHSYI